MQTIRWYDPCPRCGREVHSFDFDVQTVRHNPEAVLRIRNPSCRYDPEDPDSPDCTCTALVNPAPPAYLDQVIPVSATFTMHPCGDQIMAGNGRDGKLIGRMAGWKVYEKEVPEPGSLGELMADWAASSDEET